MSAVYIFEIKDVKKDKSFKFLKGRFFVMGAPMDMIFGLFSDIYVRLPESIPFAVKNFSVCGGLFKRILAWEGGTCKTWILD